MTKIKLCGMFREADIEAANEIRPDYIGFVLAQRGHRQVTAERAMALRRRLAGGIQVVGVFVNQPPEEIAALLDAGVVDIAQLHGGESEETVARLRALTKAPIFKAFSVTDAESLNAARASGADRVLLDCGAGGTGRAFDWSLLEGFDRPYLLAGGLSPDNVEAAVLGLRPWGVDVSSGIETDRIKDPAKMRAFVEAVRRADCRIQA